MNIGVKYNNNFSWNLEKKLTLISTYIMYTTIYIMVSYFHIWKYFQIVLNIVHTILICTYYFGISIGIQ